MRQRRTSDSRPSLAARLLFALAIPVLAAHAESPAPPPGERGVVTSVAGCEMGYQVRRPASGDERTVAIIAHGFMRNGTYMAGWAEAIAGAGITAVTVDLCASSSGEGRRSDDGADLVALRRALGAHDAIYVGVSAGGLSALYAASLDAEGTRGVLLLDPVNAGGQARRAAGKVRAPVAALVAKAQVCNAWRNIDGALETLADATVVRVPHASHCDFEWPSDRFCRVACLDTHGGRDRERAEQRIRGLGVAFVRAVAEGQPDALPRWRGDIGPD